MPYPAVFPVIFDARAYTAEFARGDGAEMNKQLKKRADIGQIVAKIFVAVVKCAFAVFVIFLFRYAAAAVERTKYIVVSENLLAVDTDVLGRADFQRHISVRFAGGTHSL